MFSIDRLNNNTIALKLSDNCNDYEIKAIARKNEISINAVIKYIYSDNSRFCGNTINNYNIGSYTIRVRDEDTRDIIEIALFNSLNTLKSIHFPNIDKVVFEIFSVKIQDLYMEVKHA